MSASLLRKRSDTLRKIENGAKVTTAAGLMGLAGFFSVYAVAHGANNPISSEQTSSDTMWQDPSYRALSDQDAGSKLSEPVVGRLKIGDIDIEDASNTAMEADFVVIAVSGLAAAGLYGARQQRERQERRPAVPAPSVR